MYQKKKRYLRTKSDRLGTPCAHRAAKVGSSSLLEVTLDSVGLMLAPLADPVRSSGGHLAPLESSKSRPRASKGGRTQFLFILDHLSHTSKVDFDR